MSAYHGPDRRGIIGRPNPKASYRTVAWMLAAVAALPLLGLGAAVVAGSGPAIWSAGSGDAAFVAFIVVSVLLALQWRLIGEAACVSFVASSSLIALLIVPTMARSGGHASAYLDAVRATALLLVLLLCLDATRAPDVRSDARPALLVGAVVTLALLAGIPFAFTPLRAIAVGRVAGIGITGLVETAASAAVAVLLIRSGVARRRMLRMTFGVSVASLGMAFAARSLAPAGSPAWSIQPNLSLLASALVVLAMLVQDVKGIIATVVLQDVRGRRRWEAAEIELTEVRNGYQGQRHDLKSVLSAIDGTLLVMSRYPERLSPERTERLIAALRAQVRFLQEMFAGVEGARSYSVSELLSAIVSVRSVGGRPVKAEIRPGLEVHGRPDRLAVIVHDLLANVSTHAPAANVTVRADRVRAGDGGEVVEVCVADDGPGIPDGDMSRAMERGWRGSTGRFRPGSGLGLYQCRELAEREGGSLVLEATHALAPAGRRGLTARIRIPLYRPETAAVPRAGDGAGSLAEILNSAEAPPAAPA